MIKGGAPFYTLWNYTADFRTVVQIANAIVAYVTYQIRSTMTSRHLDTHSEIGCNIYSYNDGGNHVSHLR